MYAVMTVKPNTKNKTYKKLRYGLRYHLQAQGQLVVIQPWF